MTDLQTRDHVKVMVHKFYEKATRDDRLGPIFNDVAQVDWDHHLPRMYDFWESILFGTAQFDGNPMDTHIRLNQKVALTPDLFERWLHLFFETVDEHFEGPKAEEAKNRAQSIAGIMQYKIRAH